MPYERRNNKIIDLENNDLYKKNYCENIQNDFYQEKGLLQMIKVISSWNSLNVVLS